MADGLNWRTAVRAKISQPFPIGSEQSQKAEDDLDRAIAILNERLKAKGAPIEIDACFLDSGSQLGLSVTWLTA